MAKISPQSVYSRIKRNVIIAKFKPKLNPKDVMADDELSSDLGISAPLFPNVVAETNAEFADVDLTLKASVAKTLSTVRSLYQATWTNIPDKYK